MNFTSAKIATQQMNIVISVIPRIFNDSNMTRLQERKLIGKRSNGYCWNFSITRMARDIKKIIATIKEYLGEVPQYFFSTGEDEDCDKYILDIEGVTVQHFTKYEYIEVLGLTRQEQQEFCEICGYEEGMTASMIKSHEEWEARQKARAEATKDFDIVQIQEELKAKIRAITDEYGIMFDINNFNMNVENGTAYINFGVQMYSTLENMENKHIERKQEVTDSKDVLNETTE